MTIPANRHTLHRTSPKGLPFVGTCSLCGRPGLTISDMNKECDNPRRLSRGDALLEAIKGPPGETPMERSTGNRKYLREEDCEDNDEGA